MNSNMSKGPEIDTLDLFRMPWSMSDNALSWIEPTRYCDLTCEYCYQIHDPESHKTLEQFEHELEGLLSLRKTDALFIAGGEPLTHPKITEIVKIVHDHKVKPVILSNGFAATRELITRLKNAGAHGFTFHIDAKQNRPGWENATENDLNRLRQNLADMVYKAGGLVCGFNTTIVPDTLHEVADIVSWTVENIDRVSTHTIIPVRTISRDDPWDYYAGCQKVEVDDTVYGEAKEYKNLTAKDLYGEILKAVPDFKFNSYLGGTVVANAPKWLFGNHIGSREILVGNMGKKSMEMIQNFYHLVYGKYCSYLKPGIYKRGKLLLFLSLFDKELRKTFKKFIFAVVKNPLMIFKRLSFQTIIVMQPQDVLPNGEQDQCDGCPNKTYWNGRLVSECRMEDYLKYGRLIQLVKKTDPQNCDEENEKQNVCEVCHE